MLEFSSFEWSFQDQRGELLKGSKPQDPQQTQQQQQQPLPQQQQKQQQQNQSIQQQPVQRKFTIEFEGPVHSPKPQMKCRLHRRNQQQHERDLTFPSPRSPNPRQHIIDSLLSLAMTSMKQPQPPPSFSTLVQGGPSGFRSPRRQQVRTTVFAANQVTPCRFPIFWMRSAAPFPSPPYPLRAVQSNSAARHLYHPPSELFARPLSLPPTTQLVIFKAKLGCDFHIQKLTAIRILQCLTLS